MAKKYCYSEFEAAKKAKPKVSYFDEYCRNSRNQVENREQRRCREWEESEDDFEATYRLPPTQTQECCPCKRNDPTEMSDSSDLDSIQGFGFIEHYRRRGPNAHNYEFYDDDDDDDDGTDMNTSELFNVDRYVKCLGPKKSVTKEEPQMRETYKGPSTSKGYRQCPSTETLPSFEMDKRSSSSDSSRNEPPKPDKPNQFLPMTESYLRHLFRSTRSPQSQPRQREENQGLRRQDQRFMRGHPSPERVPYAPRFCSSRTPCRKHCSPRSSTRFSTRFHPRQMMTRSESSEVSLGPQSSEQLAETESELSAGQTESIVETESLVETESIIEAESESIFEAETDSNDLRSFSSDCYSEYSSLGKRIVRESRRNLEMGMRCPRVRGGALATDMQRPCIHKPAEPRYKVTNASRMHFRPSPSGCPRSEVKAKRSTFKWKTYLQPTMDGEDQPMESLLSPRSLVYSQSTCSVHAQDVQLESRRTKQRALPASEDSHLTPPDLAEFPELPEVSSSQSGPQPSCRCSQGQRLPSLNSRHTFTNVWRKGPKPLGSNENEISTIGGLYGKPDELKFKLIDRLDAGVSLTPIVEGCQGMVWERIRYFAIAFDRLSIKERMQDTELRFRQIRKRLAGADRACLRHFRGRKAAVWPMTPEGHKYVCPIGHDCCPKISDGTALSHTVLYHHDERGFELREIFAGDRMLLIFNPRSYIVGRNSCMSAMAYAGIYKDPSTLPGRRFMPQKNRRLPNIYARYPEHLPLFVMTCRLKRSLPDDLPRRCGCRPERDDVLIFWVTSVDLPYPVHVIMTVMNRRMDATRSTILQVRPLHESQNCLDMMQSSCQYMRLGEPDLRVLTSGDTEPLYLEISVKEYAGTLPRQPSSEGEAKGGK